ncbi:MAG: hypothetical protein R3C68_09880 [Myxococcota bacterium]
MQIADRNRPMDASLIRPTSSRPTRSQETDHEQQNHGKFSRTGAACGSIDINLSADYRVALPVMHHHGVCAVLRRIRADDNIVFGASNTRTLTTLVISVD